MATFRSTQSTRVNNAKLGTYSPNPANQAIGALRCSYFSYTTTGTEVAADKIEICDVPAGARILGIYVASVDLGTTVEIAIGDSSSAARLVDAVDLSSSAFQAWAVPQVDTANLTDNPSNGFGYKYTEQTTILATFNLCIGILSNKPIRGFIAYMVS